MTNTIKDNWYEDFFQGINCELWEKAVTPEWTKQEVDFLIHKLNLEPNSPILDIPCGFGRHSIELSKRGFHVTGVDISKTFITMLNEKIHSDKLKIRTILEDILYLHLDQKFSGAICMGNSFGYFDLDKMKLFVEKVSTALVQGARLVIHSGMLAESILANFPAQRSYTVDDLLMEITNIYDVEESCLTSHITYTKSGLVQKHAFKHYVFTLAEVKRLLKQYGLRTVGTYSALSGLEYKLGDPQVYLVAEKA